MSIASYIICLIVFQTNLTSLDLKQALKLALSKYEHRPSTSAFEYSKTYLTLFLIFGKVPYVEQNENKNDHS